MKVESIEKPQENGIKSGDMFLYNKKVYLCVNGLGLSSSQKGPISSAISADVSSYLSYHPIFAVNIDGSSSLSNHPGNNDYTIINRIILRRDNPDNQQS